MKLVLINHPFKLSSKMAALIIKNVKPIQFVLPA
jgi:hypothetical protein